MFAVVLSGCASISDKAAPVQVHTQISSVLDKCKRLGPVTASTSSLSLESDTILQNRLREAVVDLGGDTLVLLNTDYYLTKDRQHGIAFRCY
jgi:hypothetical protein